MVELPRKVGTVVVGAGASGSVIAARMTESADHEVLLVEAGPDRAGDYPADLDDGRRNSLTDHDWGMKHRPTRPQIRFPMPRGRVVGGSSAVNTCIAIRGTPDDYDGWAARGLPEWTWSHCLPAFNRLETDEDFGDRPWHGDGGPLPVRRDPEERWAPWPAGFVAAAERLGFPRCPDSNEPGAQGVGPHAFNRTADHRRISAAQAWLTADVRARENLTLAPDTHVVRVVTRDGRAVGVDVLRDGRPAHVAADRVVLCGGALQTPGILLRSGIGPQAELDRLGVRRVADVPGVAHRLCDHPGSAVFVLARRGSNAADDPIIQTALRLRASGDPRPSGLQIQAGGQFGWDLGRPSPLLTIMFQVGRPKGHGRIRWPSRDPHAKPEIDSRFYEHPDDLAHALEAMEIATALLDTPELRALHHGVVFPRRGVIDDRDRLRRGILRATDSGYHPCGTVPMGADDDPMAACDGRGRVRGVEGLVVGDASLMPDVPSPNIHLPTLMIGERVGAWLRDGQV